MTEHKNRAHALLSASGSKRWLNCTPSARIEDEYEDSSSQAALEGTLAHEIAEQYLRKELGEIKPSTFKRKLNVFKKNELYQDEMLEYIEEYGTWVMEIFNGCVAEHPGSFMVLEERIDYSDYVEEGFGTGDVKIVADTTLHITDFKYGKGVKVFAKDNSQMRLYGLGALKEALLLFDITEVCMSIAQPRLHHYDSETMSVEDLLTWGEEYVKPRAKLAYEGKGEFCAGEWCQFCSIEGSCKARAESNLAFAKEEFCDVEELPTLTPDKCSEIYAQLSQFENWVKKFKEYCLHGVTSGDFIMPGYKLVEGRGKRVFPDPDAVAKVLMSEGGFEEAELYTKELLGITALEKLVGKKAFIQMTEGYVDKQPGKPTLVDEADKRPAINTLEKAKEEFADVAGDVGEDLL